MAIKTTRVNTPAAYRSTAERDYLALVKQFPLVSIQNEAQLTSAQNMIDALLRRRLKRGETKYLGALSDLVEAYEKTHEPPVDVSEANVLRELMRVNKLTQKTLEKQVGIAQSTISAVVNGERSLTRAHIQKLAHRFRVSPAAFLPRGGGSR